MRDCTEPKVLLTDSRDYVQRSKRLTFIMHSENPSVPPMRQARALELRLPGRAVLQLPFPRPPCPCSPNSCWRRVAIQTLPIIRPFRAAPRPETCALRFASAVESGATWHWYYARGDGKFILTNLTVAVHGHLAAVPCRNY